MASALAEAFAAVGLQMADEVPPLHTAISASSKCLPAMLRASARLNSNASFSVILRLSSSFLTIYARNFFDPANPPVAVLFDHRRVIVFHILIIS